ncbi:MAG: helix-turn-helix domain-containing protein [Coprobacillus sp.]|nr:helix-turn-helix domain-containing protein [Coprobacillus sp.]
MSQIGERIQYYRKLHNLSQSDLASQLYVTTQAVSKWETGNSEPDLDTVAKLAKIFNVTIDDLYSTKTAVTPTSPASALVGESPVSSGQTTSAPATSQAAPQGSAPTRVIDEELYQQLTKRQIGVCDDCQKPILEGETMHVKKSTTGKGGRKGWTLCDDCFMKRRENWIANEKSKHLRRRKRSWAWAITLASITFVAMLVAGIAEHDNLGLCLGLCIGSIAGAYVMLAFVFTVGVDNTFVGEMFTEVASWGFVRMPGVIFGWSVGGIIFLITIKLFFFLVSLLFVIVAFLAAFFVSALFSIFAFPVAVHRAYKHVDTIHLVAKNENPYRLASDRARTK